MRYHDFKFKLLQIKIKLIFIKNLIDYFIKKIKSNPAVHLPCLTSIYNLHICYSVTFIIKFSIQFQAANNTFHFRDTFIFLAIVVYLTCRTRFRIASFHTKIWNASPFDFVVEYFVFTSFFRTWWNAAVVRSTFLTLNSWKKLDKY